MKAKFLALSMLMASGCLGQSYLGNILLIINYNHAHYGSIPLLRKMYEPYFDKIVFYGPGIHPEVHRCEHHRGYFSYMAIADAMARYPDHNGYFFLHDDVILNAWRLGAFDHTKIWCPSNPWIQLLKGDPIDLTKGRAATTWSWWGSEWGYGPALNAFNEIPDIYKQILAANRGPAHVVVGNSDIVYIPNSYKQQFIELAHIFRKHKVFLEIALPTMVSCLAPKDEWLWFSGGGIPDAICTEQYYGQMAKAISLEVDFNHPVKLSYPENRAYVEKLFEEMQAFALMQKSS